MRTMDYTEGNHICMHFLGDICSSQKIRKLTELDEEESQHDLLCTLLGKKRLLCNSHLKPTALAVQLFNM